VIYNIASLQGWQVDAGTYKYDETLFFARFGLGMYQSCHKTTDCPHLVKTLRELAVFRAFSPSLDLIKVWSDRIQTSIVLWSGH
jgi:hypothetical protein